MATINQILEQLSSAPYKQKSMKAICETLGITTRECSALLAPLKEEGTFTTQRIGQLTIFKLHTT